MTRSPSDPRIKTRLAPRVPSEQARRELALAFLSDLTDHCRALEGVFLRLAVTPPIEGLRIHMPGLAPDAFMAQRGSALGDRLRHACEDLASSGFTRVVLVGADLPDMSAMRIEQAVTLLTFPGSAVIGPSGDGGCYLIGLRVAPGAVPDVFSDVRWDTPHSREDLTAACGRAGLRVQLLQPWNDVDTPADLDRLAARLRDAPSTAPRTAAVLQKLDL